MGISTFMQELAGSVGQNVVNIFGALCVLIVGWIVALVISKVIETALKKTKLDEKIAPSLVGENKATEINLPYWVSKIIFYFLLVIVFIGFFNVLHLDFINEPLKNMLNEFSVYLPNLFAAALLLLLTWAGATLLRLIFLKAATGLKLDEKLSKEIDLNESQSVPLTKTIGDVAYWLTFLLSLPFILDVLDLKGLLGPVQEMWYKVFHYIPQILGAGFILLVGWFFAKILQKITANLLAAIGLDTLSDKTNISQVFGGKKLSYAVGLVIYIIVLLHVITMALSTLSFDYLTQPFINLLHSIYEAIPNIFAAAIVLIIAYLLAKVVSDLCKNLLTNIGCDSFLVNIGIWKESENGVKPAEMISKLVMIAIMFAAAVIACERLHFTTLALLGNQFMIFAGKVILGLIIFIVGVYLSNIASAAIRASQNPHSNMLAFFTRIVILVFAGAVALQQVVPENEIVVWGFILISGAIAVAIAVAFGVGGIGFASRKLEEWSKSISEGK